MGEIMRPFKLIVLPIATALCMATAAVAFADDSTLLNGAPMPGPTNTGPTDPNILQPSGSLVVTTPGAVIQNLAVSGTINVEAPNVTIENCTVDAGSEFGT